MPRKPAEPKLKGRMSAYAFFVQTCRAEHQKKHPDEKVVFAEFSKKCAERWKMINKDNIKNGYPTMGRYLVAVWGHHALYDFLGCVNTMSDKEKKRFRDMAEKDKKRVEEQWPEGKPTRGKKRQRAPKDPNAPKRNLSAFFWFCNDERPSVRAENPSWAVGDVAKELSKRWADVTPEEKVKYEEMAVKDKARYEKEKKAYENKLMGNSAANSNNAAEDEEEMEDEEGEMKEEEREMEDEEEEDDDEDE